MKLTQFDKLQRLVEKLIVRTRELRQENYRLKKENKILKEQVELYKEHPAAYNFSDSNTLQQENLHLKEINSEAKTKLAEIISFVEKNVTRINGVEHK